MIIGIGGVSRAGKTTLAENLKKAFVKKKKTVEIFCLDDFAKTQSALTIVDSVPDWERPSTIKWDRLISKVEKSSADIKIVEGLFTFYPASVRSIFSKKIFVEIDKVLFQARRYNDKRWDKEPEWYVDHVWKSYLKYGKSKGEDSEYIFLNGAKPIDINILVTQIL
ncbi:MAG: nicotinamide/nicotinate riboside kinase [Cyclobacteriaceae bacterium]|jgi:nicotinamide/nicotinate riboside kinase